MFLRTLFVTCLVFFHFQEILIINAWPTLQVTILNYTQSYVVDYVEYSMVQHTSIPGAYDVNLTVRRTHIKPIVRIGIYFGKVEFMNKTIDVCKVAHSKNEEPLLRLAAKVVVDNSSSRTPRECPIKKGKYYNLLNRIETNKIPPIWPETEVTIYIDVFSKEPDRVVPILSQVIHCQFQGKRIRS